MRGLVLSLVSHPLHDYLTGKETGSNLEACFGLQALMFTLLLTGTDLCSDSEPCSERLWEASQQGRLPLAAAG